MKEEKGYKSDTDLTADDLKELVNQFKAISKRLGKEFPQDPWEQLWAGIGAVFQSWMVKKAVTYRKLNNIPGDWGTAVNVQTMVFGNAGDDCATGVCFSRDPATGENVYYGEYLVNAQGEDVVAGIRTPQPMASKGEGNSLEELWPHLYQELVDVRNNLENTTKICRIWNSPLNTANFGCCNAVTVNVPLPLPSVWLSKWLKKAC